MSDIDFSRRGKLVKEIGNLISERRLSLYLGAGVSIPSKIPGWSQIVKECCRELKIRLSDYEDNYYKLLEFYANQKGREALTQKFKDYILSADLQSKNEILSILSRMNFNKIWTTNFDNLLRHFLQENLVVSNIINTNEGYANLLLYDGVSIIKLNGDFDVPNQVLTEQDYLRYETNFKNLYLNFQSDLYTHSFLIIGSSLSDGLFLPSLFKLFQETKPKHTSYCFMQRPRTNRNKINRYYLYKNYLKEIYNIEIIEFNEYNEIPELLNNIHRQSINKACFVSGSLPQIPRDQQSELEDLARDICEKLSLNFIKHNIKIFSCFGMLIGNYLSFPITSHCMKNGESISKYFQAYPLNNRSTEEEMYSIRSKVIDKGKFFIALAGSPNKESGVYKEYEIAKKLKKNIIPIPVLGGCGDIIYTEMYSDPDRDAKYPYLHKFWTALRNSSAQAIADTVLEIINSVNANPYS